MRQSRIFKTGAFLFLIVPALSSCQEIDPARNRIVFTDKLEAVQDSILNMQKLLEKLPKTYRTNYFVDYKGYLYVNNTKLGLLKGAINNPRIRKDMSFERFSDKDFKDFFWLMAFLAKNHIESSYFNETVEQFVFYYRETEDDRYNDIRAILVNSGGETRKRYGDYKVLDTKGKLILVAPYDAVIK